MIRVYRGLVLACLLLPAGHARSQAGETTNVQEQLASGEAKELQILESLRSFDDRIAELQSQADGLARQASREADRLLDLEAEMATLGARRDDERDALSRSLRAFYIHGRRSYIELVLESESMEEVATRGRYLMRLIATQRNRAATLRDRLVELETRRVDHATLLSQARETRNRIEQQRAEVASARAAQLEVFQRLKSDLAQLRILARRQELAQEMLGRQMERAAAQIPMTLVPGSFSNLKGDLPWPVLGRVQRAFGRYEIEGERRPGYNPGIDIVAAAGTEVRAVADGVVVHQGWVSGLGRTLIVQHADGYRSVYTNARTFVVENEQQVRAGEVVGFVGETGSLVGAKLHFQLRKGTRPVNPSSWLGVRGELPEFE